MGYSQEHVASTRQRILDEAGRLMRKHGQAGVSINQIMEAADLTHGGFYAHFKSKKELLGQAVLAMNLLYSTSSNPMTSQMSLLNLLIFRPSRCCSEKMLWI